MGTFYRHHRTPYAGRDNKDLHKRGVNVMLSDANDRVTAKLKKSGMIDLINNKNNFTTFR